MRTIELEIEVNNEPVNVTVDYMYYAGEAMIWTYSNGDPGHPGSGPEVDICAVIDGNGKDVPDAEINMYWTQYIIEKCLEDAENIEPNF